MATLSPLPDSHASLSKYITLEAHFALLQSIINDTTLATLSSRVDDGVLTTARKRYFLEKNGLVRRDRLIDLIHEEGALTDRIRMIMYFLFLLRDGRYRDFVCTRVAGENGVWDDSVFEAQSTSFFPGAGGRKAFTNLRQLLVHTKLLTPSFKLRKFPDLESWFSDGVEIAAQHIVNPVTRRSFLEAPQAVLFKYKIHGLLNTTANELLLVGTKVGNNGDFDSLPSYEPISGKSTVPFADLRPWTAAEPTESSHAPRVALTDPVLLERANNQHRLLEKMMANCCGDSGHSVSKTEYIDLLLSGAVNIVFEMKSCTFYSIRSQVRRGISQLLEYRYLYRKHIPNPILCMVIERKPRGVTEWLIDYVDSLGVCLVWKEDQVEQFGCSRQTKTKLLPILGTVVDWKS